MLKDLLNLGTLYSITEYFGANLAERLAREIRQIWKQFNDQSFIRATEVKVPGQSYTQRIEIIADLLKNYLPNEYRSALDILLQILGPENPNEDGMFKHFYWVIPIGKFVEKYGIDHYDLSINAIAEITKRNTGEYAIRPFIKKYPNRVLKQMHEWAKSPNFHLRRLASEGLRPKLPWAPKLDIFIGDPYPVFEILEILKEDPIKFVQKSVANHLADYLKVNYPPTNHLLLSWSKSEHPATKWIIRRATRKIALSH